VEDFGCAREDWFKSFLELPNGMPSHDTYNRVFSAINPKEFESCFINWTQDVCHLTKGEVIAIDGKTARGSSKEVGKKAVHIVSAWACENKMVLGQVKVDEKTNEIKAIPELLEWLNIKGCIITIDAMGCQKDIAQKIIDKKADYLLSLKGNQGTLLDNVTPYFKHESDRKDLDFVRTVEKDHGRIEIRKCWVTSDINWIHSHHPDWDHIQSVAMVESTRTILKSQETSVERRYYISSLPSDAQKLLSASRQHWGIENSLHWVLDMTFNEDRSRIRNGYGQQNFSLLRKSALNLIKKLPDKRSLNRRRFMASIDQNYLMSVLEAA